MVNKRKEKLTVLGRIVHSPDVPQHVKDAALEEMRKMAPGPQRIEKKIEFDRPKDTNDITENGSGNTIDAEAVDRAKQTQYKRRVRGIQRMLAIERKQRGEDPQPRKNGQRIKDWSLYINASPEAAGAPAEAVAQYELREERIMPSLRIRLTEMAQESDEVKTGRRIAMLLKRRNKIAAAERDLEPFRIMGKPLGIALVGDQMIIEQGGIKLFVATQTPEQKRSDGHDRFVHFEDIASGQVTISVAPSMLDKVRRVGKLLRRKTDGLPGTVIIEEKGTGRRHVIRNVPAADKLVDRIRTSATWQPQLQHIQDQLEDLSKQSPQLFGKILNRLNSE